LLLETQRSEMKKEKKKLSWLWVDNKI
jgi:hypothetical protein